MKKALYSPKEAAECLGCTPQALRSSRVKDGKLSGVTPPKHTKIGAKTVRYKITDLDKWISSLEA